VGYCGVGEIDASAAEGCECVEELVWGVIPEFRGSIT